jgi:excisionase family DNA binding protein
MNKSNEVTNMKTIEQDWCPKYVTTSFIADCCGVSAVTVLSWIGEKRLPAFRLPKGHYRIYREDFIEFLTKYHMTISHRKK